MIFSLKLARVGWLEKKVSHTDEVVTPSLFPPAEGVILIVICQLFLMYPPFRKRDIADWLAQSIHKMLL